MSSTRFRAAKHAVLPLAACAAVAALTAFAAPPAAAQERATRIVIDKDTKRARMAEHDEIAAAKAAASARSGAAANAGGSVTFQTVPDALLHGQPVNARFGARGHRVDEKRMSFTVINRNADGTWATQCVTGETASQHAMHSKLAVGGAHDR
jgi:hypothetical protein